MWIVLDIIEKKTGAKKISDLTGIAHKAPVLTIFLFVIAMANIALPLTNAFPGELLMFTGLFEANPWFAAISGLGIVFVAIYILNLVQKVFYGETNTLTAAINDIGFSQKLSLAIIVVVIFAIGIYPQPILNLAKESVPVILGKLGM